jgi:threonine dehydrogenase-like Zn-dependent dehydrogenase
MVTVTGLAFPGGKQARLQDFEIGAPQGAQVRVAIKASGICGSDLHTYCAEHGLREPGGETLLVAGHEPAGVIESIGPDVTDFAVGDRVLVYHICGCGNCQNCRLGHPVVCESSQRAAYGGERNGAHAPLLLVEQRSLIRIPEPLTFVDGAMIACGVGTAYSALLKTGVRPGQRLLVTGLGPVGLAVTLLAANMGVIVIGSDPNPARVEVARAHGLDQGFSAGSLDEALQQLQALTAGEGVEAAIECSGAAEARSLCLQGARTWGQIVFVGVSRGSLSFNPTRQLIVKMLTVRGSWVSSQGEMQELAELLARRELHPEVLVTHRFGLEEAPEAYRRFAAGESGKMVIVF